MKGRGEVGGAVFRLSQERWAEARKEGLRQGKGGGDHDLSQLGLGLRLGWGGGWTH